MLLLSQVGRVATRGRVLPELLSGIRNFQLAKPLFQTAPAAGLSDTQLRSPVFNLEGRKTTKHLLLRKTFLVDLYKHLNDESDIVLYCHHNNIPKADNIKIRLQLKNLGVQLTFVRNSVYKVYLRSAHEEDPALHTNTLKNKQVEHPLAPLLNGPTAIITIKKCDPPTVEQVLKVLKSMNEKLFLIGARVESSIYDTEQIGQFKDLPLKEQLQGQLAGLLSLLGGAGLIRTLESAGTHLYLTLDQRRKDIDPEEKKE